MYVAEAFVTAVVSAEVRAALARMSDEFDESRAFLAAFISSVNSLSLVCNFSRLESKSSCENDNLPSISESLLRNRCIV